MVRKLRLTTFHMRPARGSPAASSMRPVSRSLCKADDAGRGAERSRTDHELVPSFLSVEPLLAMFGIDPELAQSGRLLAERADEVVAHEPWCDDRVGRRQAEVDMVNHKLQDHLVLVIAPGDADGQHGLPGHMSTMVGERVIRGRLPGSMTSG